MNNFRVGPLFLELRNQPIQMEWYDLYFKNQSEEKYLKYIDLQELDVFIVLPRNQCWTVGAIFTFGRSRMFGPEKLRPLAVGRSRSRRIKKP